MWPPVSYDDINLIFAAWKDHVLVKKTLKEIYDNPELYFD
jgi:hypothetical protein